MVDVLDTDAQSVELPADVAAKLEADYGDFSAVKTTAGWVAMKCASKPTYDRYMAMLYKESERAKGSEFIAKACVVYANGTFADVADEKTGQIAVRIALDTMLNKRPGILGACANCALEATGVDGDAETKKYGAS